MSLWVGPRSERGLIPFGPHTEPEVTLIHMVGKLRYHFWGCSFFLWLSCCGFLHFGAPGTQVSVSGFMAFRFPRGRRSQRPSECPALDFRVPLQGRAREKREIRTAASALVRPSLRACLKWVWVKMKAPGDRRLWSLVPFTRDPKRIPIFDQPNPLLVFPYV